MNSHKRSSLALSAVALAVVASIVACAAPGQGPVQVPPTLALPTSVPVVTVVPAATATPAATNTQVPTQTAVVWTATPVPVIPTATSTPFAVVTVAPVSAVTFSNIKASTNLLYTDSPCSPLDVEFSVIVSPLSNFSHVVLFYGLPWFGSPYIKWNTGVVMNNNPGSTYFWKGITHETINKTAFVTPEPHPSFAGPAPLYYQFVATDAYYNVVGRSPVYRNVSYAMCSK
jgi:hypothetical protein